MGAVMGSLARTALRRLDHRLRAAARGEAGTPLATAGRAHHPMTTAAATVAATVAATPASASPRESPP